MNRSVPEVQVPLKVSWINYDHGVYSTNSMDPEKDGSYSSQDAAMDLTPLTMNSRRWAKNRKGMLPIIPAVLRQSQRRDQWTGTSVR